MDGHHDNPISNSNINSNSNSDNNYYFYTAIRW